MFNNKWHFGHINYDFKNIIFPLQSNNKSTIAFPDVFFFEADIVVKLVDQNLEIETKNQNSNEIFEQIINTKISTEKEGLKVKIQPKISKEDYIKTINQIKHHIQIGDCYELNFCQEFSAENVSLNPVSVYQKLNEISPTPFSCFYKLNDKFLLCASPERFIKKEGSKIISQPIKGTAKRNLIDVEKDKELIHELKQSQKEKSENIMIVDLVRNDLSKICKAGSVFVEELMEVYSFKQVHQMISTIVGELKHDVNFYDIIKALFPMGSMTGAPKLKVMQLIDTYEKSNRSIYSGSIGYINPNGDFDFNVVIRSILYDDTTKKLSYQVGSAITHYSNAEDEYAECLLKASAIEKALGIQ